MSQNARVAVISGAANGIGQAYAKRLATDGLRIVIADVGDAGETLKLIEEAGGTGIAVRCDVSSPDDVTRLASEAASAFGQVDILVHNAAIYPITFYADMTFAEWRKVMSVNLDSAFLLSQAFLPGMRERGWGRIVNMVSTTFHAGSPGMVHYVASKGGVIGLTRSLAAEVGEEGVTVNAIAPGLVQTDTAVEAMSVVPGYFDVLAQAQAIKRTEVPEDLVGTLSFLVSDDAAFMTGQTLCVDGGWVRA